MTNIHNCFIIQKSLKTIDKSPLSCYQKLHCINQVSEHSSCTSCPPFRGTYYSPSLMYKIAKRSNFLCRLSFLRGISV